MENMLYYKDFLYGKLRYYIQPYIYNYWQYNVSKITENIYISDLLSSMNKERLKEDGITHILCTILGVNPIYPDDFVYKNIYTRDIIEEDISKYFDDCALYIHEAIEKGGKVLVHCSYGISRSATIVIAYLMKYQGKTYDEAYKYVKEKRDIIEPNEGFKKQLKKY